MGWESRRYDNVEGEGGGGFRAAVRRVFGDGENPLTWSLPLYTAWGIRVRIHLVFVIMIIAELIRAIPHDQIGLGHMALGMGGLFVLVLLHEYGHCFACRWVGGEADQILMWPLGGLAYCAPPHQWRADLITTIGGPMVNVALAPVLAAALLASGSGSGVLVFNPFDPAFVLGGIGSYWISALWWLYYMNWLLLGLNLLLPMYPLDGARIAHALMWRRMGERRAMAITATAGLVTAVVVGVAALVWGQGHLLGIAIFGGITCWFEKRRLAFVEDDPALAGYDFSRGYAGLPADDETPRRSRRAERQRQREAEEQAEVDRILAKIASEGMASLSAREKRTLKRATERRRHG